jgi:hypothetical protein
LRRFEANPAHGILEQQPVLGLLDSGHLGADQLNAIPVEHARFGQLQRQIQTGLPAHRR